MSIKTKASRLLEHMCESDEEFFNYFIRFSCGLLCRVVGIKIEFASDDIVNVIDMLNLTQEESLEISLQGLSTISYLLYKNDVSCNLFKAVMQKVNPILIQLTDEFLLTKLINFYSFHLDDLFNNHETADMEFYDSVNLIFRCLFKRNENFSVNLISLEAISTLAFDESIYHIFEPIIISNLSKLISIIEENSMLKRNQNYFKLLKNCFKSGNINNEISQDFLISIFNYFWDLILKALRNENSDRYMCTESLHIVYSLEFTKLDLKARNEVYYKIFEDTYLNNMEVFLKLNYDDYIFDLLAKITKDQEANIHPNLEVNSYIKFMDSTTNSYLQVNHYNFIFSLMNRSYIVKTESKVNMLQYISKYLLMRHVHESSIIITEEHVKLAEMLLRFILVTKN